MYSNIKSVQILISLLKQYGVKDVVLSPGGSDIPLIHSIEMDNNFNCYSVVDERNATYFAMGLAQEKNTYVACICTSGTAICNYLPGVTEAYYQDVPILVITADKNPYFQGQLETQKIDQMNTFTNVVKRSVDLPVIRNEDDEWLCNRLINEALLELNHHGTGPVHINIPITGDTSVYDCKELPKVRKMNIVSENSDKKLWNEYSNVLSSKKRIMVVVGQNVNFSEKDIKNLNNFFKKYNCIFAVEHLSNVECEGKIYTYPITEMGGLTENLLPDLVISIGNNLAAYKLKPFLRANYKKMENWYISLSGKVRDSYKSLTTIFEMSVSSFFENICKYSIDSKNSLNYYNEWKKTESFINIPDVELSNMYVAKSLAEIIPENSILHLAILNSTRTMQYFKLNKNIHTYSNVGSLGIDGCLATFVGQSTANDKLAYLVIGDLSFFYDMNAAALRSIKNNVRIILLNNGGGSEFHFFMGKEKIPTINKHISAEHNHVAEGWIKSLNYDYYAVNNKEELDNIMPILGKKSEKPIFVEIFTDMELDAKRINNIYKENEINIIKNIDKKKYIKKVVKNIIPSDAKKKIKKIIKK